MPNNKPLICCDGTKADVVNIPTIGKKVFYCRAFIKGRFVKHGNYHAFEKGMLSEEKVYFNDKVQKGKKPLQSCSAHQGKAAARSGIKLRGRPMGQPHYSGGSKKKKSSKGLVKLSQTPTTGLLDNGALKKVKGVQDSSDSKNSLEDSDSSMPPGTSIGDCPDPELRRKIKAYADQIPPSQVSCILKDKTGLAFITKVKVIEKKQMELGSKDYPCFKEMFYSRYKTMMWEWERVRLSYCAAERSPNATKYRVVPKAKLKEFIKAQPYWVSNYEYPPDLKKIYNLGLLAMSKIKSDFKVPPETENAFKPAKFLTIKKLAKDPEVMALHQKMLNTIP